MFYVSPTSFDYRPSYANSCTSWTGNAAVTSTLIDEYNKQIKRLYEDTVEDESKDVKLIRSHKNLIITNI